MNHFAGKSVEELTRDDLNSLVNNESALEFIGKNLSELAKIIEENSNDKFIKEQFRGSNITVKISNAEKEIGKFFSENEGNEEALKEYCTTFLNEHSNAYERLPIYLVVLSTKLEVELNQEEIKENLRKLVKEAAALTIENNYEVVSELQDFIYSLGQYYFDNYGEDPITDMEELTDMNERMIAYVKPFLDQYQQEFEEKMAKNIELTESDNSETVEDDNIFKKEEDD